MAQLSLPCVEAKCHYNGMASAGGGCAAIKPSWAGGSDSWPMPSDDYYSGTQAATRGEPGRCTCSPLDNPMGCKTGNGAYMCRWCPDPDYVESTPAPTPDSRCDVGAPCGAPGSPGKFGDTNAQCPGMCCRDGAVEEGPQHNSYYCCDGIPNPAVDNYATYDVHCARVEQETTTPEPERDPCDNSKYFMDTPYEQIELTTRNWGEMKQRCYEEYISEGRHGGWAQRYANGKGWCARFTQEPSETEWSRAGGSGDCADSATSGHCGAVCGTKFNAGASRCDVGAPCGAPGSPGKFGDTNAQCPGMCCRDGAVEEGPQHNSYYPAMASRTRRW